MKPMTTKPSTARQHVLDEAFKRLDAVPLESLRGVTWTRAAALADTSVVFVELWVKARGYHDLSIGHKPKPRCERPMNPLTRYQRQRLRLIVSLLAKSTTWYEIGKTLGVTDRAAFLFWQRHKHQLKQVSMTSLGSIAKDAADRKQSGEPQRAADHEVANYP